MDQNINNAAQQTENKNSLFKAFLILIVCLLLCVAGWFIYSVYKNTFEPTVKIVVTEEEKNAIAQDLISLYNAKNMPLAPEGKDALNYGLEDIIATKSDIPYGQFIFSAVPLGQKNIEIYAVDVQSSSSIPEKLIPSYYVSAISEFKNVSQPANFFLVTASKYVQDTEADGVGVHLYDIQTGYVQPFASTKGILERNLEWSEKSEQLAFNRLKTGVDSTKITSQLKLVNWELAILKPSLDMIVDVVVGAYQPKWSPDGSKLLYLKSDGLYLYDVKNKVEKKVVAITEGEVNATSMFDLSNDGRYIVWSTAKSGIVTVNEVTSWDSFAITELGRIHTEGTEFYWPQFSPNGEYYALQVIDTFKDTDDQRQNARVEIRKTKSRTVISTIPLKQFYFDALFTDDWITKLPDGFKR